MYVCVCQGVTERQIHEAARNGASRLKDLRQQLGITLDCGRCASCAHECLKDAHRNQKEQALQFVPASLTEELMAAA
jgi:bacterioferritin-associated ferredoxin